jgi:hypothetical protein
MGSYGPAGIQLICFCLFNDLTEETIKGLIKKRFRNAGRKNPGILRKEGRGLRTRNPEGIRTVVILKSCGQQMDGSFGCHGSVAAGYWAPGIRTERSFGDINLKPMICSRND